MLLAMAMCAVAAAVILFLTHRLTRASSGPTVLRQSIPSPRETLIPHLTPSQISTLAYPPNLLPGARDVDTPYGTMRVYEWGPTDGKKVLFIHGDTTPGPMLAPVAEALASRGCRVLIFDLWGRGYSDTPLGVPHNATLFGNQIFFAVASSSIPWTGDQSNGFSIVAFSLGGGIAMSFAAYYPYLVNSIVLLAPGGILRTLPEDYESPFFQLRRSVPSSYLRRSVANILGVKFSNAGSKDAASSDSKEIVSVDVAAITQWQFDHHHGFVHSFIDTIVHGPLMNQHTDWMRVCNMIKDKRTEGAPQVSTSRLVNSKLLVIFGDDDKIVAGKDVEADLSEMLGGSEHVVFRYTSGGHGFPVPSSGDVVKHICQFLNL